MIRAAAFMLTAAALIVALIVGGSALRAQNAMPDSENGRFTFRQMGDELLRLDGRTGQVSLCGKRAVGWSCLTVPDERSALETEIARLQAENGALKRELIARGIALPSGVKAPARAEPKSDELVIKLPSDAELEQVMTFMEKVWRRFIDMAQRLQREIDRKG